MNLLKFGGIPVAIAHSVARPEKPETSHNAVANPQEW